MTDFLTQENQEVQEIDSTESHTNTSNNGESGLLSIVFTDVRNGVVSEINPI